MIIQGDLRDFHFPDLIKLIVSGEHSGTLTVTDGVHQRTLTFDSGQPVCAGSSGPDGEVLDPRQVQDDIYDLFRWQEGGFTFNQRLGQQEGCLILHSSAEDLILAGARWVDNWSTIQRVVPSPDTVFERRVGHVSPDDLEMMEDEQLLLGKLDGLKDVTAVARECELTEFETSKILYGLHAVGLVQPGDLDKIRLRRVFREFAELVCKGTQPYRSEPSDISCQVAVNERCTDLPIRLIDGRIEDRTDPSLRAEDLAEVYQHFLQTQRMVVGEWFGEDVAQNLSRQVLSKISPGLQEALKRYDLV
jgi:hypothetical protein